MNAQERQRRSELAMYVGARLKWARKDCGFDRQADFGSFLGGFPATTLSRVERGDNLPGPRLMAALATKCSLNLNWLLTGTGSTLLPPPAEEVREFQTCPTGTDPARLPPGAGHQETPRP